MGKLHGRHSSLWVGGVASGPSPPSHLPSSLSPVLPWPTLKLAFVWLDRGSCGDKLPSHAWLLLPYFWELSNAETNSSIGGLAWALCVKVNFTLGDQCLCYFSICFLCIQLISSFLIFKVNTWDMVVTELPFYLVHNAQPTEKNSFKKVYIIHPDQISMIVYLLVFLTILALYSQGHSLVK